MLSSAKPGAERATERVAVLMTQTEKAAYTEQASRMGLSLGQFFREAGAAYASAESQERADPDALEAALRQLEFSTARTEAALDSALAEVRAALQANRDDQRQS
jgi:KaiC/GvpD/RAD55 family RecA-like ATPase